MGVCVNCHKLILSTNENTFGTIVKFFVYLLFFRFGRHLSGIYK